MSLGLVGRKVGMTRIFTDDGVSIPVTVLDVSNNRVAQIKTPEIDGYAAVQVVYGVRRPSRVSSFRMGAARGWLRESTRKGLFAEGSFISGMIIVSRVRVKKIRLRLAVQMISPTIPSLLCGQEKFLKAI